MNLIKDYQSLIGSFLGVIFAIIFWYLTSYVSKRREIKNNKKEIEKIFLMAARESEDALRDLKKYISDARETLKQTKTELSVSVPPRFNRIYINEERLFLLSKNLNFITSQQVDIAVSSAKKFNGYLDQFEYAPEFLFNGNIKILQSGLISGGKCIEDHAIDVEHHLKNIEFVINKNIETIQRHLLRPIVALAHKNSDLEKKLLNVDEILDQEANMILQALKIDLA